MLLDPGWVFRLASEGCRGNQSCSLSPRDSTAGIKVSLALAFKSRWLQDLISKLFVLFSFLCWEPNRPQSYEEYIKHLICQVLGRGDQEKTSNENQSKRWQRVFLHKEFIRNNICLYQKCTQKSRDHCSPHFRKRLQQEPLWLREREAAHGKCLSADRSDMGLWLEALLGKCQLGFSSKLNQLPVITQNIPCRKAWQVLKGNNFLVYFWTFGKFTQVWIWAPLRNIFLHSQRSLVPFAFQSKNFSLCFSTQPFQKNFCPVTSKVSQERECDFEARNPRNCNEMNLNNGSWECLEQFLWTQKGIEASTQKLFTDM